MNQIIAIILEGKGCYTSADFVSVKIFNDMQSALDFQIENTLGGKHWKKVELVAEGESVETGAEPEDFK